MIRLLLLFIAITLLALGLAWLADQPGRIVVQWPGYEAELTLLQTLVIVGGIISAFLFIWSLVRNLLASPTAISSYFKRRKRDRGMEAISGGMIAIGAGDQALARQYTSQAKNTLPNDPLTDLLRAQTAQMNGDNATSRRIYEAMLSAPETELLGLRGLFLEAQKENELEPARQYAQRALDINPALEWSATALFDLQSGSGQWGEALKTLEKIRKHGHLDKKTIARRRAVLLTAQAIQHEDGDMKEALNLALEAHKLAPDLVPAADIAGRILASLGNTAKAAKILKATWKMSPHPDLARTYAFARPGDSPIDRLKRVQQLSKLTPNNLEAPIAVADTAIEAHDWQAAREALEPLLPKRLTSRICIQMARIEGGQFGDKGRVREWLARAVHAPRDPSWSADGYVSENWLPVSPITGEFDPFQWQVPIDSLEEKDSNRLLEQLNVLAAEALAGNRDDERLTAPEDPAEELAKKEVSGEDIAKGDQITVEATPVEIPEAAETDKKQSTSAENQSISSDAPEPEPETPDTGADEDVQTKEAEKPSDAPIILPDSSDAPPTGKDKASAGAETVQAETNGKIAKKDSAPSNNTAQDKPPSPAPEKARAKPSKSETLPNDLRALPPPSPEIAPTSKPRIFVSPRAPDDPGPDPVD